MLFPLRNAIDKFPVAAFADYPFMLLEKNYKSDISELFDRCHVKPKTHFTTVDDYAVMSVIEKSLGISILPELILGRTPYRIIKKNWTFRLLEISASPFAV